MKVKLAWFSFLLIGLILFTGGCAGEPTAASPTATPTPQVYSSLRLNITPETQLKNPIAIRKGGLVSIFAEGFPPDQRLRVFLGAPGSERKDPAATVRLDAEGKTQAVFAIPQRWDDGTPLTEDRLLIIVEWGGTPESLVLEIGYLDE